MTGFPTTVRHTLRELRRRHVVQVGAVYVVVAWLVIQVADTTFPYLGLDGRAVTLVIVLAALGFPLALVLAWAFDVRPDRAGLGAVDPDAPEMIGPSSALRPPGADRRRDALLVLPFENISPDAHNEYFADGLTEEIIADLSHIRSLGVISRTSAMRLKGSDKDVVTLGRELGVRYVLEGSVRKAGDDVRITAQLIDATTDEHLWAEKYSGTVADVFEIQEQVASAIASALRIKLTPSERHDLEERPIEDPRALESYLRARHGLWRFSREGLDDALRHLRNAIEMVGENELLLATLGHVHIGYLHSGVSADPAHIDRAHECAERIFALNPDSRHGHRLRGVVEFQKGNLRGARPYLERALEWSPDDPEALLMLGYLYALAGREDRALDLFERALRVDPLTPINHAMPGFVALLRGRREEYLAAYRTFLEMDDRGPFSLACWVLALANAGRVEEASRTAGELADRYPGTVFASAATALARGLQGEREAALAAITPEFRESARHTEMFARFLTECYAVAGDVDAALESLENAVRIGTVHYPFLSRVDPLLENLRGDPRFARLMERVEREWRDFDSART